MTSGPELIALEHSKYEPMLLDKFLRKGCPGGIVMAAERAHIP